MLFAKLMVTIPGRLLRIVAGIAIMLTGWFHFQNPIGYAMMVIGIIPVSAGVFDVCILAPLFDSPFNGDEIRGDVQK
jgi:hypothetical protein